MGSSAPFVGFLCDQEAVDDKIAEIEVEKKTWDGEGELATPYELTKRMMICTHHSMLLGRRYLHAPDHIRSEFIRQCSAALAQLHTAAARALHGSPSLTMRTLTSVTKQDRIPINSTLPPGLRRISRRRP